MKDKIRYIGQGPPMDQGVSRLWFACGDQITCVHVTTTYADSYIRETEGKEIWQASFQWMHNPSLDLGWRWFDGRGTREGSRVYRNKEGDDV